MYHHRVPTAAAIIVRIVKQQIPEGFAEAISLVARALHAEKSAQETLQKMVAKQVPVEEGLDQLANSINQQLKDAGLG